MKPRTVFLLMMAFALHASSVAAPPKPPSGNVAWFTAATDGDIDRAFASARSQNKPVLLYWGATWCPPCNQLKATLFNRQDFATLVQALVAVHVDGDLPGAQKLGQRFKVSGYPTLVLFSSDGREITRLPGDVDAPQALAVMRLGLAGGRPVRAVLSDALAGKPLTADEWQLLAFYSWETDDEQLVAAGQLADTLASLAAAASRSAGQTGKAVGAGIAGDEAATRLWLKALAASDDAQGIKADASLRDRVMALLADRQQSRLQMDVLCDSPAQIVRSLRAVDLARGPELVAAYDAALTRLQSDPSLSRGDRLGALEGRVELARIDMPKDARQVRLPAPLLKSLREEAAQDDREITDPYERQAVITEAASALAEAGLWSDSDALLKANLARSHSSYYLMSQLASNARKLGRRDEALRWLAEAFETSEGPATRLQWGSRYLGALVDLAPGDSARIERVASRLLSEAGGDSGAFDGRSRRSLQQASAKLVAWGAAGAHRPSLQRLRVRRDSLCANIPDLQGQREACRALLEPAKPVL